MRCIYYDVLNGGSQEPIGIDMAKATTNLARYTDASGDTLLVFEETSNLKLTSLSSAFKSFLSRRVRRTDIMAVLTALETQWKTNRKGEQTVARKISVHRQLQHMKRKHTNQHITIPNTYICFFL